MKTGRYKVFQAESTVKTSAEPDTVSLASTSDMVNCAAEMELVVRRSDDCVSGGLLSAASSTLSLIKDVQGVTDGSAVPPPPTAGGGGVLKGMSLLQQKRLRSLRRSEGCASPSLGSAVGALQAADVGHLLTSIQDDNGGGAPGISGTATSAAAAPSTATNATAVIRTNESKIIHRKSESDLLFLAFSAAGANSWNFSKQSVNFLSEAEKLAQNCNKNFINPLSSDVLKTGANQRDNGNSKTENTATKRKKPITNPHLLQYLENFNLMQQSKQQQQQQCNTHQNSSGEQKQCQQHYPVDTGQCGQKQYQQHSNNLLISDTVSCLSASSGYSSSSSSSTSGSLRSNSAMSMKRQFDHYHQQFEKQNVKVNNPFIYDVISSPDSTLDRNCNIRMKFDQTANNSPSNNIYSSSPEESSKNEHISGYSPRCHNCHKVNPRLSNESENTLDSLSSSTELSSTSTHAFSSSVDSSPSNLRSHNGIQINERVIQHGDNMDDTSMLSPSQSNDPVVFDDDFDLRDSVLIPPLEDARTSLEEMLHQEIGTSSKIKRERGISLDQEQMCECSKRRSINIGGDGFRQQQIVPKRSNSSSSMNCKQDSININLFGAPQNNGQAGVGPQIQITLPAQMFYNNNNEVNNLNHVSANGCVGSTTGCQCTHKPIMSSNNHLGDHSVNNTASGNSYRNCYRTDNGNGSSSNDIMESNIVSGKHLDTEACQNFFRTRYSKTKIFWRRDHNSESRSSFRNNSVQNPSNNGTYNSSGRNSNFLEQITAYSRHPVQKATLVSEIDNSSIVNQIVLESSRLLATDLPKDDSVSSVQVNETINSDVGSRLQGSDGHKSQSMSNTNCDSQNLDASSATRLASKGHEKEFIRKLSIRLSKRTRTKILSDVAQTTDNLNDKMTILRREIAHLIAVDGRLFQQLLDLQTRIRSMAGVCQTAEEDADDEDEVERHRDEDSSSSEPEDGSIEDALDEAMLSCDALDSIEQVGEQQEVVLPQKTTNEDSTNLQISRNLDDSIQNNKDSEISPSTKMLQPPDTPGDEGMEKCSNLDAIDDKRHGADIKTGIEHDHLHQYVHQQRYRLNLSINDSGNSSLEEDCLNDAIGEVDLDSLDGEDDELSEMSRISTPCPKSPDCSTSTEGHQSQELHSSAKTNEMLICSKDYALETKTEGDVANSQKQDGDALFIESEAQNSNQETIECESEICSELGDSKLPTNLKSNLRHAETKIKDEVASKKVSFIIDEKSKKTREASSSIPLVIPQEGFFVNKFFSGDDSLVVEQSSEQHSKTQNNKEDEKPIPTLTNLLSPENDTSICSSELSYSDHQYESLKPLQSQTLNESSQDLSESDAKNMHESSTKNDIQISEDRISETKEKHPKTYTENKVEEAYLDSLCYNSLADTVHLKQGSELDLSKLTNSIYDPANSSPLASIPEITNLDLNCTSNLPNPICDQSNDSSIAVFESELDFEPDSLTIINDEINGNQDIRSYNETQTDSIDVNEVSDRIIDPNSQMMDSLVSISSLTSSGSHNSSTSQLSGTSNNSSFFSRSRKTYAPSMRNRNRASMKSTASSVTSDRYEYVDNGPQELDKICKDQGEEISIIGSSGINKRNKEFLQSMLTQERPSADTALVENAKTKNPAHLNRILNEDIDTSKKIELVQKALMKNHMNVEDFAHSSLRSKYRCLAVLATSLIEETISEGHSAGKNTALQSTAKSNIKELCSDNEIDQLSNSSKQNMDEEKTKLNLVNGSSNSDNSKAQCESVSESGSAEQEHSRERNTSKTSAISRIPSPKSKNDEPKTHMPEPSHTRKVQMVYPIQQQKTKMISPPRPPPPILSKIATPVYKIKQVESKTSNEKQRQAKPLSPRGQHESSVSRSNENIIGAIRKESNGTKLPTSIHKIPIAKSKSLTSSTVLQHDKFGKTGNAGSSYLSYASQSVSGSWKSTPVCNPERTSRLPLTEKIISTIGKKSGRQKVKEGRRREEEVTVEHNIVVSAHTDYKEALIM